VFSPKELEMLAKMLAKMTNGKKLWIGIKALLDFVEMSKQIEEKYRVSKFLSILEEEGALDM